MTRHRSSALLFAAALLMTTTVASGATVAVGEFVRYPNSRLPLGDTVWVNARGAAADGEIRSVTFRTNTVGCAGAASVLFFRSEGNSLRLLAERGPFHAVSRLTHVVLDEPVAVRRGDLIGIRQEAICGTIVAGPGAQGSGIYALTGDLSQPVEASLSAGGSAVAVWGSFESNEAMRTDVVPVVAAAGGLNGSLYRTELQLGVVNGRSKGRIVFRPERSGADAAMSIPFDLEPLTTRNFDDIVRAAGGTGKGTLDIYTDAGYEPPRVSARVIEVAKPGSMSGASIPVVPVEQVLTRFTRVTMFAPVDPVSHRMNIGIRSLSQGAKVGFLVYSASGQLRYSTGVELPPDYFLQEPATSLLGTALQPGEMVIGIVSTGSAVVYSSVVNNTTNDPSIELAPAMF